MSLSLEPEQVNALLDTLIELAEGNTRWTQRTRRLYNRACSFLASGHALQRALAAGNRKAVKHG